MIPIRLMLIFTLRGDLNLNRNDLWKEKDETVESGMRFSPFLFLLPETLPVSQAPLENILMTHRVITRVI